MDKLEAVRLAALRLDRARNEEHWAAQAWERARLRLLDADKAHVAALDALHEPGKAGIDDDQAAQADSIGAG